ncbi:hypothetical protein BSL78_06146 [Apostichopus japonicus]|uniref:Uncharacterized protein n=1 Tax=Stichopus japonicus TaxID=307972 RepID=A0A2G8L9R4_STIJA|nr:hypothetical protein BSL78_06146 [Apostichopus japonicus]
MSAYRSRQQVKCDHCGSEMKRDRLKEHTKSLHPNCEKLEQGRLKSRNLLEMFGSKTKRPTTEQSALSTATEHVELEAIASSHSPSRPNVVAGDEGPENTRKRKAIEMEIDSNDSQEENSQSKRVKSCENVSDKLDSILKSLEDLKLSASENKLKEQPKEQPKGDCKIMELEALKILIQNAKSIDRVCDLARLTMSASDEAFRCDACSSCVDMRGVFRYDVTLGTDFTNSNQPQGFRNFKKNVAKHQHTESHLKNVTLRAEENEAARKLKANNQSVGITLGKQAYRLHKYCRPYADFEVDLLLLSDAKVNVGNINHSWKFASELRPAFAEAVDSRVKDYIQRPLEATLNLPPVGIVTDKITTKRRTGQMFAGVLFTPAMDNLLTPVSLGIESVTKHDGDSIAQDIHELCKIYNIQGPQILPILPSQCSNEIEAKNEVK